MRHHCLPALLIGVLALVGGLLVTPAHATPDGTTAADEFREAPPERPVRVDDRLRPDRERPAGATAAPEPRTGEAGTGGASDDIATTSTNPQTVVFVHGLDKKAGAGDDQSHDCASYFAELLGDFPRRGYAGNLHTVGYYDGNTNCTHPLHAYGNPSAHYGDGTNSLTSNTSIRHLGYRFAWYLWNEHTAHGRNVGIVAHSMGGLVSRYAVGMTASGHPDFPPYLSVRNLATVGTPHTGAGLAWFCGSVQCQELRPGSATLGAVNSADSGASGVLNRIAIASSSDEAVSESSATAMPSAVWIAYDWPWYSHSGMLRDTSDSWSADYRWGDAAGNTGTHYWGPRSGWKIHEWAAAG